MYSNETTEILKAINTLIDEVRENKMELKEEMARDREENRRRWEENERRWEQNDKRWEENERRWKENDKRWEANEKRWKQNTKDICNILWSFQTSIEDVLKKHEKRIEALEKVCL